MLQARKWNGDSRPSRTKGPIPKGDPRDKINSHNRAQSKQEIQEALKQMELDKEVEMEEFLSFFDRELV